MRGQREEHHEWEREAVVGNHARGTGSQLLFLAGHGSYAGDGKKYGVHDAEEHNKNGFSGSARFPVQGHGQPVMTANGKAIPAQRTAWARPSRLQPIRGQRTVPADTGTGEAARTGIRPPDAPRRNLAEPPRHQSERAYGKAVAGGTVPAAQQCGNGQEQQAERQAKRNGGLGWRAGQPEEDGDGQGEPKTNQPEPGHPAWRRKGLAPGGRYGIPDPEIAQVAAPRSPGQQYGDAEQDGHEQPAATVERGREDHARHGKVELPGHEEQAVSGKAEGELCEKGRREQPPDE